MCIFQSIISEVYKLFFYLKQILLLTKWLILRQNDDRPTAILTHCRETSQILERMLGKEKYSQFSLLYSEEYEKVLLPPQAPGNSRNPKFGAGKHTWKKSHQVSQSDRSSVSHLFLLNQAFRMHPVQKIIVWILWEK